MPSRHFTSGLPTTTWIVFPDRYRQLVETAAGALETVITPQGAFLRTGGTVMPLDEARKLDIERSIMRNPVALAKTRHSEFFSARGGGESRIDDTPVELLVIDVGGETTTLALDRDSALIRRETVRSLSSAGVLGPEVALSFKEQRQVESLVYPFEVSATVDGVPSYRYRLHNVVVNGPIDESKFQRVAP